jgi:Fe-S cluster assembly protein SufB
MLKISKLADYAIIVLSSLVCEQPRVESAAWIANKTHLTLPTVSKILKMLAEAGLVVSYRGQEGGYQLAREAQSITVAEIITAMDGKMKVTECCAPSNTCMLDTHCRIKENWRVINKAIYDVLAGVTLHDMIRPLAGQTQTLRGIPVAVQSAG